MVLRGGVTIVLLLISIVASAQTVLYNNYGPEFYQAATQNFAIVQDQRGLLYFGNTDGVLEYDGQQWRLIKTNALVRSLAVDQHGNIYVGTVNDFGRLSPDEKGVLHYESLASLIPAGKRTFKDVWRVEVLNDEVFFSSYDKLFRLKNNEIKVFEPSRSFGRAIVCEEKLYVQDIGKGIFQYDGQGLRHLKGTDDFPGVQVYAILPGEQGQLLLCTRDMGLLLYGINEQRLLPLPEAQYDDLDTFIREGLIFSGTTFSDGNIAIATIAAGFAIMPAGGGPLEYYNKEGGLQSNCAYEVLLDQNGLLWSVLDYGISSINYKSPFTFYTDQDGLEGAIYSLENHQGELYIGTSHRGYKLSKAGEILQVNGSDRENWFLESANGALIHAHYPKGFLQTTGDQTFTLQNHIERVGVAICAIPGEPDLLLGATHGGFYVLQFEDGKWEIRNYIEGFDKATYAANLDGNGNMWVRCAPNDLYRLRFNDALDSVILKEHKIIEADKVIATTPIPYLLNEGKVVFGSDQGVFEYVEKEDRFIRFEIMKELSGEVSPIYQDRSGNIWYEESTPGYYPKGVFLRQANKWTHVKTLFHKFSGAEIYKGPTGTILETDSGKIALATTKGLVLYDPTRAVTKERPFIADIRRVYLNDTLHLASSGLFENTPPTLTINENNLKFDFTTYFYEDSPKNTFSTRLLGRDEDWSAYTSSTFKEYTNLPEGDYSFQVIARNLYDKESEIATYDFKILPPWYRRTWAYIGFCLGIILAGYLLLRINANLLQQRNDHLESVIANRTAELQLEKNKSEQLSNNLLRLFAIIGHDMRRPVLAFQGITKKINFLLQRKDFNRLEQLGTSIEHEAQMLYRLTDNLLNWAMVQRKIIPYHPSVIDLTGLIADVIDSMKIYARDKQIDLSEKSSESQVLFADVNSLGTILRNLIDNAIKFTPSGGSVTLSSRRYDKRVEIEITDTGVGMTSEVTSRLFSLDHSKSSVGSKGEKGAGIGLYLVHELVQLNRGQIKVSSEVGKGTSFLLTFPAD